MSFIPSARTQHNSFYNYVKKYYIEGLASMQRNALLINSDEIPLAGGHHFSEVFPDSRVDLSLQVQGAQKPI